MQLFFACPYWGQEHLTANDFITKALEEGYDGIEMNIPESESFVTNLLDKIDSCKSEKPDFIFIAQQVLPPATETVDEYINRMKKRICFLTSLQPDFINSHTGKDYFSFDDNCRIIEAAENISQQTGIPVFHETHRGRFSFHAAGLLPYLKRFPEIKLVADISHWCTVSESMLQDQQDVLEKIFPHVSHIHARVGYEQGPQVNDPFAPEWQLHMATFIAWWQEIIAYHTKEKRNRMTITPEFGPPPYMPVLPFSRQPITDQWKTNAGIKELLKTNLNTDKINE